MKTACYEELHTSNQLALRDAKSVHVCAVEMISNKSEMTANLPGLHDGASHGCGCTKAGWPRPGETRARSSLSGQRVNAIGPLPRQREPAVADCAVRRRSAVHSGNRTVNDPNWSPAQWRSLRHTRATLETATLATTVAETAPGRAA